MADYNETMRSTATSSYGDAKWSKERELNTGMSISPQSPDELTNKLRSLGGN